jgi:hypothetical protein
MAQDGSFAISVGTDNKVLLFDIRVQKAVGSMDVSGMSEMYEVALSGNNQHFESTVQNVSSIGGSSNKQSSSIGYASIGHMDGSVSTWNL